MMKLRTLTCYGVLLALAACTSTPQAPAPTPTGDPSSVPPTPAGATADVYFVESSLDDFFLAPEATDLAEDTPEARLQAALEPPADPDLSSAFPEGVGFALSVIGGTATVNWDATVLTATVGSSVEVVGVQAVVWTLTEHDTIDRVRFTVDGATEGPASNGRTIEDWWGHTALQDLPMDRDPNLLSPITISAPREGDEVSDSVTIAGEATVFEATVEVRLRGADGSVTDPAFTTATRGAPERGTWTITLPLPEVDAPRAWTIEAFERSAQDDSVRFITTRAVTIVPAGSPR
jgi:hypothetical protein